MFNESVNVCRRKRNSRPLLSLPDRHKDDFSRLHMLHERLDGNAEFAGGLWWSPEQVSHPCHQ
jgi:hypothetical protein